MTISIQKTLPSSSWYTGSGDTTITLTSVSEMTINTKKRLIKTPVAQSSGTQTSSPTDKGKNYVKDLQVVEDTIKLRGWLADDASETAWNKAWKLRAMCANGGPLTNATIENVQFSSSTQQAFLEEVTIIAHTSRSMGKAINVSAGTGIARVEVELTLYLGDPR
jgi:hypothetical protein